MNWLTNFKKWGNMTKKRFLVVDDDKHASGFLKPRMTLPNGTKIYTISKKVHDGALKAASEKYKELKESDV